MITKLEVAAFKGFKSFIIEPQNVNIIVGANGTGKTNFADLIEFLSLTSRYGLKEAIDMCNGFDEIRKINLTTGRYLKLHCTISLGQDRDRRIKKAIYSFTLSGSKKIEIEHEELSATIYDRIAKVTEKTPQGKFKIKITGNTDREIIIKFKRKKAEILFWSKNLGRVPKNFPDKNTLLLNAYSKISDLKAITDYFSSMKVYNIDATVAKSHRNGNEEELNRTGSNMISFLKESLENNKIRNKLLSDLQNAVPYIQNITIETLLSKLTLKFSEIDSKQDFRFDQMSDGTVRLLGLLAVLRQPNPPPVIIIEEPENALHSYSVKLLLSIAREVSINNLFPTQIFLTSHSPTVVDEVLNLENQNETPTQGFVTKRKNGSNTIEPCPDGVMRGIAKNLGRPSTFLREGSFKDGPSQIETSSNEKGNI